MKKLLLLIIILITASILMPSLITLGTTVGENGDTATDGATMTSLRSASLVSYVKDFPQGIVLNPLAAENSDVWINNGTLAGLEWDFIDVTDDEKGKTYKFTLEEDEGRLVLNYHEEGAGEDDGDKLIPVYLVLHLESADDEQTGDEQTGGQDKAEEDTENGKQTSVVDFVYNNVDGRTRKSPGSVQTEDSMLRARANMLEVAEAESEAKAEAKTEAEAKAEAKAKAEAETAAKAGDVNDLGILFFVPEGSLIKYTDYTNALDEASKPTSPPPTPSDNGGVDISVSTDKDILLNKLLDVISTNYEMNKFVSEGSAQVVLDVKFDNKDKVWQLTGEDSFKVVSSNHEIVDTSNNTFVIIGFITLIIVSLGSLGMNIFIIKKRARR